MRVNTVIIKNDPPLHNIKCHFSHVTVVVGDNERGKTRLLNWIAKGLFENPNLSKTNSWSEIIDHHSNVQFDIHPFYHQFDGKRMKNLLFVQETDLLFKYKNQEELSKQEYWNEEINSILYGTDEISLFLQKKFARTMGVGNNTKNSWLTKLHETLLNLKNTMVEFIDDVETVNSKQQGLYTINDSLSQTKKVEQKYQQHEDIYFTIEKVQKAQKYFDLIKQEDALFKAIEEKETLNLEQETMKKNISSLDDEILDLEQKEHEIKIDIAQLNHRYDQAFNDPTDFAQKPVSEYLMETLIGVLFVIMGIYFAYQFKHLPTLNIGKLAALASFVLGGIFTMKSYLYGLYVQQIAEGSSDKPNFVYQLYMDKLQKDIVYKERAYTKNTATLKQLREDVDALRKKYKESTLHYDLLHDKQQHSHHLQRELDKLEKEIFTLYNSNDIKHIYQEMNYLYELTKDHESSFEYDKMKKIRYQREELLEKRSDISQDFESQRNKIVATLKSLIQNIHEIGEKDMIEYFYPEVYKLSISRDLNGYSDVLDQLEVIVDQVAKDRYKAEKIYDIYQNLSEKSENLLVKTIHSEFFEYLTHNIFGGKYHSFYTQNIPEKGIQIIARTHHGEEISLEHLSLSTYAQFWFILRISLAKTIIGSQQGILLLDDPFATFDTLRKQGFIDVINALVHEGWQIIMTTTNDDKLIEDFTSLFQSKLTVLNLNKDYQEIS